MKKEVATPHKPHIPVMLDEVLQYLSPKDGETYVDCTFGAGGYSRAILESSDCNLYSLDRDKTVKPFVDKLKKDFPKRFNFLEGKFGDAKELLNNAGIEKVDGIVLDLGVSSMQLDQGERGFSFSKDAPLDMRMGNTDLTAEFVVNNLAEGNLADIIYYYGEEVKARHIAKKIVEQRKIKPLKTTTELADIVRKFYPRRGKIDPATKTFQAIRIYINDELGELKKILQSSKELLKENGRLVVVSFHSLEDGIVKKFTREESGYKAEKKNKYKKEEDCKKEEFCFTLLTKKPVGPTEEEIKRNPRSRSSRSRAVRKN